MLDTLRCKKCRHTLLSNNECNALIINAHSLVLTDNQIGDECSTIAEGNLLFLNEDSLPEWIRNNIEEENWAKGKLNCKQCGARIGAFDFVSGIKCACDGFVLPAVHIIKSKVDVTRTVET